MANSRFSALQQLVPAEKLGAGCASPLCESFTLRMRPLLDAVDRLRSMGVMEEGISLPTIVVVGDQSSGKSSVLESLSRVELPKGQGIVTRVPLVLRLKGSPLTKITIAYNIKVGKLVHLHDVEKEIKEEEIADEISSATIELAGSGKGITDNPITLNVSKPGAPDLTLVDLPGITRVPVHGQPDDIYEKIHALIENYIKQEETIILNVLSAAMDFSVCESIHMSRQVDKLGKRTVAVVTKVDLCPDGLLEKITSDAVKIGLGYTCVRNRTAKQASFQEAAEAEKELFSSHAELRNLRKSMVGVEALANRLVQLQSQSIAGVLPRVMKQIDSSIEKKEGELKQLGYVEGVTDVVDCSVVFFNVSSAVKRSLQESLLGAAGSDISSSSTSGPQLYYTASLHKEFMNFNSKITSDIIEQLTNSEGVSSINRLLSESLGTTLPNVVPQVVIEKMVSRSMDDIAKTCAVDLPFFVHDAARKLALSVVAAHAGRFPNLKRLYTTAFQKALDECKSRCCSCITRVLEMEKSVVYTTSSELYRSLVEKLRKESEGMNRHYVKLEGVKGYVDLAGIDSANAALSQAAHSVVAYWIILSRRLGDEIPRELRFSFNQALLQVTDQVVTQVVGSCLLQGSGLCMEDIMAEEPEVMHERLRLKVSLDLLSRSKDLISQVLADAC